MPIIECLSITGSLHWIFRYPSSIWLKKKLFSLIFLKLKSSKLLISFMLIKLELKFPKTDVNSSKYSEIYDPSPLQ